ncbi:MAG: tetraacyldisaccharide 4'-kinase, partial [Bacteroidales bacterium]
MLNRKNKWVKLLLAPAGFFFRMAVGLRNLMFDYKWIESKSFRIPVISVGNITVGGTGKT